MTAIKFKKEITFSPSEDLRDPDPLQNCGVVSPKIRFTLVGPNGAVAFICAPQWYPRHCTKQNARQRADFGNPKNWPTGWDLGFHSYEPRYEDHIQRDCDLLEGGHCYPDGSGLNAIPLVEILITKGSDGVWEYLENYYKELFGEDEETETP